MKPRPLWQCKRCGRFFANRNQSHACGRHDLEHHFRGKRPEIRALFDQVVAAIRVLGPVRVLPEKTRIAFQVRMSFAQVTPRANWLDGHVVLARRLEHRRFRMVQTISPRNHVHTFRLATPGDVDAEFCGWLAEAYAVGQQRHIRKGHCGIQRDTATMNLRYAAGAPGGQQGRRVELASREIQRKLRCQRTGANRLPGLRPETGRLVKNYCKVAQSTANYRK